MELLIFHCPEFIAKYPTFFTVLFFFILIPTTVYVYFQYGMPGIGFLTLFLLAFLGFVFFTKLFILLGVGGLLVFLSEKFY